MATKILLKKSATTGSAPLTTDLEQAELAINLADRKVYTKDNSNAIICLGTVYIDSVAPPSPSEGDLWYDTANNVLKAHNGSNFVAASTVSLVDLGLTATATELNYVDGVTSSIQTQLDNKQPLSSVLTNTTASFTTLDETKLDGIEANADVTDTANVTAAGALMDSEVTNLAAVKAFNPTDYATAAQGALASSAIQSETDTLESVTTRGSTTANSLSVGGLTVTGDLTVTGTTTTVNSNTVNIGDNIIVLNSDVTGTPSESAGFEIERGTSSNVAFLWDETNGYWSMGSQELSDVVLDGGTY